MMQANTDFGTGSKRGASHSKTINIKMEDSTLTNWVFPPKNTKTSNHKKD